MLRRRVRLAAVLGLTCLILTPAAPRAAGEPVPGRVVVSFAPDRAPMVDKTADGPRTGIGALDDALAAHAVVRFEPLFGGMLDAFEDPTVRADLARHFLLVHADKAGNEPVLEELRRVPGVQAAVSDETVRADGVAYAPDDLVAAQWHLRAGSMGGADVRAVGGWAETLGDSNVVVAVVDTGVDWHHPDLGGPHPDKVGGAIWTNWDEYHGTPGVDDDGNGKVDDVRGWDFVDVTSQEVVPGEDYGTPDDDPMDFQGHGTWVAGCVSPLTDNGLGIAAVAPGCRIMPLRIGWASVEGGGLGRTSFMAQAFVYAAANGADIVNLSFSTSYYPALGSAVDAVIAAGGIICKSAGNDNYDTADYLCSMLDDEILVVAATDQSDHRADFSNYGPWVDLSAPGLGIYTTAYYHVDGTSGYGTVQGTSFASPITAGACALIWSAHPSWTAGEVVAHLLATCDDLDAANPAYAGQLGAGRVNLLRALGDGVHLYPQEFPTIFDALNSAAEGDTVKVAADAVISGTLQVPATGISVLGAWDAAYAARDPENAMTQVTAAPGGTGLLFVGDADDRTVVDGFRISGGGGVTQSNAPYTARYGGGVLLSGDSPVLRNLEITDCSVGSSSQLGCGGGIAMKNSSPLLENVHVHGNSGIYGAGIFVSGGAPVLHGCRIEGNVSRQDNGSYPARGGGLHVVDAAVTLTDCVVAGHDGLQFGGGVYAGGLNASSILTAEGGAVTDNLARDAGGGVYVSGGEAELRGVRLAGNGPAAGSSFMRGGGLYGTAATVSADSLRVEGNSAHMGGGISLDACVRADVIRSVFTGNSALVFGGALHWDGNAAGDIANNTMSANSGNIGAGGLVVANGAAAVTGNISAFNTGGANFANGIALLSASASLACNDVHGNAGADWSGVPDPTGSDGNIDADPLFCDADGGNFALAAGSPCLPAEDGCGLIGALAGGCGASAVDEPTGPIPAALRLAQNHPNPFNPTTRIGFALPASGQTELTVFDVAGRRVRSLVQGVLPAGGHEATWNGTDDRGRAVAAGVYFCLIEHGGQRRVMRMALVR